MIVPSIVVRADLGLMPQQLSALSGFFSARDAVTRRIEWLAFLALSEIQAAGDRARRDLGIDRSVETIALRIEA